MAELNLSKPICFFDLETTGTNVAKDRIVEISIIKVHPDGKEERFTKLVNPEMKIPKHSSDIHGITDEKVANEPTFKELAPKILELIKSSDLAGYNSNRFDVPLLAEELLRTGFDFDLDKHRLIDVQVIFFKKEPRNLSAAYRFYCDKSLENAHSAEADTLATYEILKSQIDKYEDIKNDAKFLSNFSFQQKTADLAGFIGFDKEGNETFNFGKYKGQVVKDVLAKDKGYFNWIQNADFPLYTKRVLTAIKLQDFNNK